MPGRLTGQRIVVTGGGRGIGAEMAKAMAAEGGRLVIADLDEGIARETAAAFTCSMCAIPNSKFNPW